MKKKISINLGANAFSDLIRGGYHYIDKSLFIRDFLRNPGQVNVITRPRGFGKSLNLSMLKSYLEIGANPVLFDGLAIQQEKELHDKHFGKYPVLRVSLASDDFSTFDQCLKRFSFTLQDLFAQNLSFLASSSRLGKISRARLEIFTNPPSVPNEAFLIMSLKAVTAMFYEHYGKPVVILIDDYDSMIAHAVPLELKKRIQDFLSGLFAPIFKGNRQVEFVVLTGCLWIANSANNEIASTVSHPRYADSFGLTEDELAKVLEALGLSHNLPAFQEWYGAYLIGGKRIYNTWSVMSYCNALLSNPTAVPKCYWANTSGSDILFDAFSKAESENALTDLERLVFAQPVRIALQNSISPGDFPNLSSILSLMVHSGYLTPCSPAGNEYRIPNKEVKAEFIKTALAWVKERAPEDLSAKVVSSIWNADTETIQNALSGFFTTQSSSENPPKHACNLLLLGLMNDGEITGTGETFITLANKSSKTAALELKKSYVLLYMLADALQGVMRIRERGAEKDLALSDYGAKAMHFGISFCMKKCLCLIESAVNPELIESAIGDMQAATWCIRQRIDKKSRLQASRRMRKLNQLPLLSDAPDSESALLVPPPPLLDAPDSESWFTGRESALEAFNYTLDHEKTNFNFELLLETTAKLVDDLNRLLIAERIGIEDRG
ncbi:MAG: AAA family ATPase [Clostridiales bacterium]|jgi:hypothetical protein|nr:AAA family ATPase [Clostridiales bacterium]